MRQPRVALQLLEQPTVDRVQQAAFVGEAVIFLVFAGISTKLLRSALAHGSASARFGDDLDRRADAPASDVRAAAGVLRRQRRLPLPRPGVRRAAVRAGRRRSASPGCGSRRPRVVFALWRRPWRRAALDRRERRLSSPSGVVLGGHERVLLPRDRAPAARHRRRDRVPAGDRARRRRRAHARATARARARGRRRLPAHRRAARRRAARASRFAFANAVLFALYIVLAPPRRAARRRAAASTAWPPRCWSRRRRHADRRLAARARRSRDPVVLARRRSASASRSSVDPVRLRPARDGAAAARDLRAAGLAAARDRDRDRVVVLAQIPTAPEVAGVALVVARRRHPPRDGTREPD